MGKRILIVDDEENVTELLRINMVRRGFEVLAAFDGEQALRLARSERPDLLLLDICLPGMDGLEVCRMIRQNPQTEGLAIVVLSAAVQKTDRARAKESGATCFIAKPFDMAYLLSTICELTSGGLNGK